MSACAPHLDNARSSPEELAQAVLDAMAARDRDALTALMVTREEERDLLWDQLPASRTTPFDFQRTVEESESQHGIDLAISRFGGQAFELVKIEFRWTDTYTNFMLHRGTTVHVRPAGGGDEMVLYFLDVVLERRGRWKVMHYRERVGLEAVDAAGPAQ